MLALFEMSPEEPISPYVVGERALLKPKAVNAICKELMRANFIKKISQDEISLTANGRRLVEELTSE